MHKWNGSVIAHILGLFGCEARDYDSTNPRLSIAVLDDPGWVHLKLCCYGVGLTATIWS